MKIYYNIKAIFNTENTKTLRVYIIKDNDLVLLKDTYLVKDEEVENFNQKEIQNYIIKELVLQPNAVEFIIL